MPLTPFTVELKKGWKNEENNRQGDAVVIVWKHPIKEFAPTLADLDRLSKTIDAVRVVDQAHKLLDQGEDIIKVVNSMPKTNDECRE